MSGLKRRTILSLFRVKDISEHGGIIKAIDSGLDVNTRDSGGRTILMEAVIRKDLPLVVALIDRGADVNSKDNRKWTALHFTAQNNDRTIGLELISAGADVNAADDYGNNVIWRAAFEARNDLRFVRTLLKSGANPNEKNEKGISAEDLAITFDDIALAELFED